MKRFLVSALGTLVMFSLVPERSGAQTAGFVAITPCRMIDTRKNSSQGYPAPYGTPAFSTGERRVFTVDGAIATSNPCAGQIPGGITALAVNFTAVSPSGAGDLREAPGNFSGLLTTSIFNFSTFTIANATTIPVASDEITVGMGGAGTGVLMDVYGYYVPNAGGVPDPLSLTQGSGSATIEGLNTGSGDGVHGSAASAAQTGVYGQNLGGGKAIFGAASGAGVGVQGGSDTGSGVYGGSNTGNGAEGHTNGGASGVYGSSDNGAGFGVAGRAGSGSGIGAGTGTGVLGDASSGSGVLGLSSSGAGVWGESTGYDAVHGHTTAGTASGVAGFNDSNGAGTFGSSANGYGVWGISNTSDGVHGETNGGPGVSGVAGIDDTNGYNNNRGVYGYSEHDFGIYGHSVDGFAVLADGYAEVLATLSVIGDLSVLGDKNFVMPHPVDPSKEIVFTSLEGPESGTYFRGTGHIVNGFASIEVPDEFRLVTSKEGMTVQLTPVGDLAVLAAVSEDLNRIVVRGSQDVAFHYLVNGVRSGFENHETIRANKDFVPRGKNDSNFMKYSNAEALARLKANGILNDDGSINEETAHKLGWDQRPGWDRPDPSAIPAQR